MGSDFLFSDYQDALIFYKDGRQFTAPVNFNLQAGHFLFVDAKDGKAKQFASPEKVAFLKIDSRDFVMGEGEAIEILQVDPYFQVAYSGNLRQAPKNTTYGGTTQTAAVDAYVGYSGSGVLSSQRLAANKIVVGINKRYGIKNGEKVKWFNNIKTFLKIIPKEQRGEVLKYIEMNNVDFENIQQVHDLYKYVHGTMLNK